MAYDREKKLAYYRKDRAENRGRYNGYAAAYRAKHPDRIRETLRLYRERKFENTMLARVKYRAKKLGVAFDLTIEDIKIPEVCPCFGLPFVRNNGRHPCNPSVDRIDPTKGYVRGNIWIISKRANTIKNNATIEELSAIVEAFRRKVLLDG